MSHTASNCPVVICFSGHDPSGGAGIQADIETLASINCHASTVITALTVQNSTNVKSFTPVDATLIKAQATELLADMPIAAFKIGMVGTPDAATAIYNILCQHPQIPVVFDPVLAAGGGGSLSQQNLIASLQQLIIPKCTLITPNTLEIRALCPDADTLEAGVQQLMAMGCQNVLMTGGHEDTEDIINTLWIPNSPPTEYRWPRLAGEFHGSGCTLAAACSGYLAKSIGLTSAVKKAQAFTHQSLQQAQQLGKGQTFPKRQPILAS